MDQGTDGSIDGWRKSLSPESVTKIAAKTPRCWLIYILKVPEWPPNLHFCSQQVLTHYSTCTEYQARHHYKSKEIIKNSKIF